MTNNSEELWGLRVALRESQDSGLLPCETEAGRRFQMMVGELATPVLRELVMLLCREGLTTPLIMGMDEAVPYVGIQWDMPETTLWIFPSTTSPEGFSKVQGWALPGVLQPSQVRLQDIDSVHLGIRNTRTPTSGLVSSMTRHIGVQKCHA